MYTKKLKNEILEYVKNHTWSETVDKYKIAKVTINRWKIKVKKENQIGNILVTKPIEKKEKPSIKIQTTITKPKTSKPIVKQIESNPIVNKSGYKPSISVPRGLIELIFEKSERNLNKKDLEQKLKNEMLNPKQFGKFLINLGTYLESL